MKQNNLRKVSKLLRKKSTSYLKISFAIFIISLIIVSSASVVGISQYMNLQKEFIKNDNTHVICVSGIEYGDEYDNLTLKDKKLIEKIIKSSFPNIRFNIILESRIPNGISDKTGNHFSLFVVGNDCGKWLKLDKMEDNTIYSVNQNEKLPSQICLELPIIKSEKDGMSADTYKDYNVNFSSKASKRNIFETYNRSPGTHYYINYNTYVNLTSVMYGISKDSIKNSDSIENLYIYVENIGNVEKVANVLISKKYATDYTLKAFDSLDHIVQLFIKAGFILILAIFIFTCINLVLSFNSYIKLQKKDIAILKHLGYSNKNIKKIYRMNIADTFLKLGVGIVIYTSIIGGFLININNWLYLIALILLLAISLFIVFAVITETVLKRYVKKDILELMKIDKSFE